MAALSDSLDDLPRLARLLDLDSLDRGCYSWTCTGESLGLASGCSGLLFDRSDRYMSIWHLLPKWPVGSCSSVGCRLQIPTLGNQKLTIWRIKDPVEIRLFTLDPAAS